MKKVLILLSALFILVGPTQVAQADAPAQPVLVSFSMSPDTIDIATPNTTVAFELIVSNPTGIASTQSRVTLTNGLGNTLVGSLTRADSPINSSLATVNFRGSILVPSTIAPGVYTASASPITALNSDGTNGYSTNTLFATSTTTLKGAINSLLVRSNGTLNFAYPTFAGPTFNNTTGGTFLDPSFLTVAVPIWKVGETFDPKKYYELKNSSLTLKIKSNTPTVCTSDVSLLSLISLGACSFTVYTDKTNDYQLFQDNEIVNITTGRTKPTYVVGTIATQSSAVLPLSIPGPFVFSPFGTIVPISTTPTICFPAGTYITIVSGGTCTLNYSTPASGAYLASDVYALTFQISRNTQTVMFTVPTTAALASKTLMLNAAASSGNEVTFQSDSPTICSVTGNSLNLLKAGSCQIEALQVGTTTISPMSVIKSITVTGTEGQVAKKPKAKQIVCVKNGKSKIYTGVKCPVGYKANK